MDVGTEVWVKSASPTVWLPGVVVECDAAVGDVKVRLEGGGDVVVTSAFSADNDATNDSSDAELHIRNKERDVDALASLTGLEHLHEPALLHALSERFARDRIYTSIGDILVAVNPLKPLDLYAPSAIDRYKRAMYASGSAPPPATIGASDNHNADRSDSPESPDSASSLPPHVFAIGARAFGGLLAREPRNQSVLVSGESGSGKTESTKFLMQFLTSVGSDALSTSASSASGPTDEAAVVAIGRRILQTTPILESFGNAQTIRNDNSSRFGKFIKLQFGPHHEVVGAELASYLLEKVRLIHQSPGERNFHVFYELLEGAGAATLTALGLERGAKYELLNAYGSAGTANSNQSRRVAHQFAQRFAQTVQAFEDTGVAHTERDLIFRVLAALLHLGNVNFMTVVRDSNSDGRGRDEAAAAVTVATRHHFDKCAELLGVSATGLESLVLTRRITAGSEVMVLQQNAEQAKDVSRSLAKAIYGRVFSWLVRRLSDGINYCDSHKSHTSTTSFYAQDGYAYDEYDDDASAAAVTTIGILDIFGFESLAQNGFEQLCINYANERLQAQFNEFVFIKEQDVYTSEAIDWRAIPFPSNAACLALFDDKASGLFSLLDQECLMPKGSDEALSTKFYRYHGLLQSQPSLPTYTLPQLVTSFGRYLQPQPSEQVEKEPEPAGTRNANAKTKANPFFASKMDRVKRQFVVHHFAGNVSYRIEQFVEKNLDMLPSDVSSVLHASSNAVVSAIGDADVLDQAADRAPGRRRFSLLRAPSVSAQFKSQLDQLVDEIGSTQAHYVRCLKPNELKRPGIFDRERMVEQLRSVGVLEALRIARAGYSVRLPYAAFIELFSGFRAHVLSLSFTSARRAPQAYCAALVASLVRAVLRNEGWKEEDDAPTASSFLDQGSTTGDSNERADVAALCRRHGVQVGRTLVFCKTEAFNKFSRLRLELRTASATLLQRHYRGYRRRRRFQQLRDFVHRIQSIVRGFFARKHVAALRRERQEQAATAIQRIWRRKLVRGQRVDRTIRLFRVRVAFKLFRLALAQLKADANEADKVEEEAVWAAASDAATEEKRLRVKSVSASDSDSERVEKEAANKHGAKKKTKKQQQQKEKEKKALALSATSRGDKRRAQQRVEASESDSSSSSSSLLTEEAPRKKANTPARSEKKTAKTSMSTKKMSHRSKYVEESESDSSSSSSDAAPRKKKSLPRKMKHRGREVSESSESKASSSSSSSSDARLRKKKSFSRSRRHRVDVSESDVSESSTDESARRKAKKKKKKPSSSSRYESSKTKASKKKKKKSRKTPDEDSTRNTQLENEILRLKLMLIEKQSTLDDNASRRVSHVSRKPSLPRIEVQVMPPPDGARRSLDVQMTRAGRRSLSLDVTELSAGEDEDGDEVSLLPPRRTQSVYQARDHVATLSHRIEELDAKCKFLEQLVARKSYDEASSVAYSQQRSAGSSSSNSSIAGWDRRRRYPSVIGTDGPLSERDFGTGAEMDGMIRSIQQQMDTLRQSMVAATKDEAIAAAHARRDGHPTSFTSSRRTRSSSAASSGSLSGLLGDPMQYHSSGLLSPAESHRKQLSSAGSGYSAGSLGFPPTPTSSLHSRSLPIRAASMSSFGGGGGRHVPRIVKWARSTQCFECEEPFNIFVRRHHCRMCGNSFCHEHSSRRVTLLGIGFDDEPVRVCDACFADHREYAQDVYPTTSSYSAFPSYGGGASAMSALGASHTSAV